MLFSLVRLPAAEYIKATSSSEKEEEELRWNWTHIFAMDWKIKQMSEVAWWFSTRNQIVFAIFFSFSVHQNQPFTTKEDNRKKQQRRIGILLAPRDTGCVLYAENIIYGFREWRMAI